MDGARENPDRLLESSLLFGGLAGRQIFVSIHFCCLFIIFMGVHPLTFFLCFVGERLRPSEGLRPRGEEGRPGRRHRRPGRRQRRRISTGGSSPSPSPCWRWRASSPSLESKLPTPTWRGRRRRQMRRRRRRRAAMAATVATVRSLRLERGRVGSPAVCGGRRRRTRER
jgi:hypothetical protein